MYKKKNNKTPFPEIASGEGPWKIFEDEKQPRTSVLSKEMYVPTSGDVCDLCGADHNKMIRRHELGHAKWSPKTIGKLKENESEKCVEICEEVRVNYNLSVKDLWLDEWTVCEPKFQERTLNILYNGSVFDITAWILINMKPGTGGNYYSHQVAGVEFESIKQICEELYKIEPGSPDQMTKLRLGQIEWAMRQANKLYQIITYSRGYYRKPTNYNKTRKAAIILNKLMDEFNEQPQEHEVLEKARQAKQAKEQAMNANRKANSASTEQDGAGEDSGMETLDELMQRNKEQIFNATNDGNMNYKPQPNNMGKWGKMEIFKPYLDVNMQSKIKGGREYRPMDYGVNPKYMNRWCVDKKVFKQKQRVYGGTILIDASGSMHFSGQDILDIMQLLPAVTIAMYNDNRSGAWDTGSLRIIGQNGKRVNQEYLDKYTGGGNLVDGPALKWLSKQPPKRIWVSDMYVFGLHNHNSENLLKDCIEICKRSGITRLANIDEVKKFALALNQLG